MRFSKLPDDRAASAPDAPCMADARITLNNAEFHAQVLAATGVFAGLGIGVGDVVAVMLPNQVEFAVAMFAVADDALRVRLEAYRVRQTEAARAMTSQLT